MGEAADSAEIGESTPRDAGRLTGSSTRNATGTRKHTSGPDSIAVCIPFYAKEVGMLAAAIEIAASRLPCESEFMLTAR
jgi:hypothetical protein